jgi:hypothetical protein
MCVYVRKLLHGTDFRFAGAHFSGNKILYTLFNAKIRIMLSISLL